MGIRIKVTAHFGRPAVYGGLVMRQRIRIDKAEPNRGVLDFSWLLDAPAGEDGFTKEKEGGL